MSAAATADIATRAEIMYYRLLIVAGETNAALAQVGRRVSAGVVSDKRQILVERGSLVFLTEKPPYISVTLQKRHTWTLAALEREHL